MKKLFLPIMLATACSQPPAPANFAVEDDEMGSSSSSGGYEGSESGSDESTGGSSTGSSTGEDVPLEDICTLTIDDYCNDCDSILFESFNTNAAYNGIFTSDSYGDDPQQISPLGNLVTMHPSGKMIVFPDSDGNTHLQCVNGYNHVILEDFHRAFFNRWTPDGRFLLDNADSDDPSHTTGLPVRNVFGYEVFPTGTNYDELCEANDGVGMIPATYTRLTFGESLDSMSELSSDGNILFWSNRARPDDSEFNSYNDLFIRKKDGEVLQLNEGGDSFSPRYSPDEQTIVYQRLNKEFVYSVELWAVDVDGTNDRQLKSAGDQEGHYFEDFRGDSEWIAYSSEKAGLPIELKLMNLVTGEEKEVAQGQAAEFSQDGQFLVYNQDLGAGPEIAVTDLCGNDPLVLTESMPGQQYRGHWTKE